MTGHLNVVKLDRFIRALDRAQRAYLISGVASALAERRGRVVSSSELLEAVYGCSKREPEEAAIALTMSSSA